MKKVALLTNCALNDTPNYFYDSVHQVCFWVFETSQGLEVIALPADQVENPTLPMKR